MRKRDLRNFASCALLYLLTLAAFPAHSQHHIEILPEKTILDEELSLDMTISARDWAKYWSWKHDVLFSYAVEAQWKIIYHPLTHAVAGREIIGIIVTQESEQQCMIHYAVFAQQIQDGKFINTRMKSLLPRHQHINCNKF